MNENYINHPYITIYKMVAKTALHSPTLESVLMVEKTPSENDVPNISINLRISRGVRKNCH